MRERTYICIDLKSFYASVECVARGLDPMTTNLVVADPSRTEKTICLAVSPSMKALGVKNRCRLFQIPKNITYITAVPRMQKYIDCSADIYGIYLKYIAKEDIHVYSIDEVFMDVTDYLPTYGMCSRELAAQIMQDIYASTGIPSSAGIGTNLYLAKIALDITAKCSPDRIGELTESSYRDMLWQHQPLTDFWRIGHGTAKRLARLGIHTMEEVANADENILYKTFGIDAELLIDHAWGREPTTIRDIKHYKPKANCLSSGQVLSRGYEFEEGKLIVREMVETMTLDLVDKGLAAGFLCLGLGFGHAQEDAGVRGTVTFDIPTNSTRELTEAADSIYDRIMPGNDLIHHVYLTFGNLTDKVMEQYDFFCDPAEYDHERKLQTAMLSIKKKYGKNGILKGINLQESSTMKERNEQIGGHRA